VWDNKTFSQTKGSKEIKDFWIRNSDSFVAFCIDSIDEDYECFIQKKILDKGITDIVSYIRLKVVEIKILKQPFKIDMELLMIEK